MNAIKGDRLHVKLGASQVRRRLQGLGFGVRKVESAGRGEAVIIHTATGQHLRELQAIFQDVRERDGADRAGDRAAGGPDPRTDDTRVQELPNLGPTSAAWLAEIGVHTRADLQRLGAVVAYRLVKQRRPRASLNLLWAIEGALTGRDWRHLSKRTKQRLRQQAEEA